MHFPAVIRQKTGVLTITRMGLDDTHIPQRRTRQQATRPTLESVDRFDVGDVIDGRYRVLSSLAAGAWGSVRSSLKRPSFSLLRQCHFSQCAWLHRRSCLRLNPWCFRSHRRSASRRTATAHRSSKGCDEA